MKKILAAAVAVVVLLCSLTFSVSAAVEQYNNKGFQLYPNDDFIQDTEWAEKYCYVDYWHTEDYGFEMVLSSEEYPGFEFLDKYPGENRYSCHIIHDELYGYASYFVSTEEIEINGNVGKRNIYKKEIKPSEEDEWEEVKLVVYSFEKEGKYYQVHFYIHNETLYGFYPDMIMKEFNISKYTALYNLLDKALDILPYAAIVIVAALLVRKKFKR